MNDIVQSGFYSPVPRRESILDDPLGLNLNASPYAGGLAETAANTSGQPGLSWEDRFKALQTQVDQLSLKDSPVQAGPSQSIANATALGGLGLGLASFLDNRKTARLQRSALRQDIAASKAHNEMKQANRAAWNNAFANTGSNPNTQA